MLKLKANPTVLTLYLIFYRKTRLYIDISKFMHLCMQLHNLEFPLVCLLTKWFRLRVICHVIIIIIIVCIQYHLT